MVMWREKNRFLHNLDLANFIYISHQSFDGFGIDFYEKKRLYFFNREGPEKERILWKYIIFLEILVCNKYNF